MTNCPQNLNQGICWSESCLPIGLTLTGKSLHHAECGHKVKRWGSQREICFQWGAFRPILAGWITYRSNDGLQCLGRWRQHRFFLGRWLWHLCWYCSWIPHKCIPHYRWHTHCLGHRSAQQSSLQPKFSHPQGLQEDRCWRFTLHGIFGLAMLWCSADHNFEFPKEEHGFFLVILRPTRRKIWSLTFFKDKSARFLVICLCLSAGKVLCAAMRGGSAEASALVSF